MNKKQQKRYRRRIQRRNQRPYLLFPPGTPEHIILATIQLNLTKKGH